MSSSTRTRCSESDILLRDITPRERTDGETLYVAPRRYHRDHILWEYIRTHTRLVHPDLSQ